MTERNVQLLVKEKVIPRAKHGRFDLALASQAYIKNLKDRMAGHIVSPDQNDLKSRKLKAETEEREAKAALRQIELEVEKGNLLRRDEVTQGRIARLVELRAAMLELPRRAAFRFSDPRVKLEVEEEVNKFVVECLDRYSRDGIIPEERLDSGGVEGIAPTEGDLCEPVRGRKPRARSKVKLPAGAVGDGPDSVSP